MINWYQINVTYIEVSGGLAFDLHYQIEKDQLMVSPNVRLAGFTKVAHISNEPLAKEFLDKCLPILKKRHGKDVELSITNCSSNDNNKKLQARINKDSTLIQARLSQNIMAPNKKPTM